MQEATQLCLIFALGPFSSSKTENHGGASFDFLNNFLRERLLPGRTFGQALLMEQHQFDCFACGYQVQTSGPYPFFIDQNNLRQPYPTPAPVLPNGRERGFDGLYSAMSCSLCDQQTTVVVSQFYSPISHIQLESGQADPMEIADPACSTCGNKKLLFASSSVACPRCPRGQLVLPSAGQVFSTSPAQDQRKNFFSQSSEVNLALRTSLLVAWIPLTLLAALFSLSAATGSLSACQSPGPDLKAYCSGVYQWLSLLSSLGPIVSMLLGGYFAVYSSKKSLWPLFAGLFLAFVFAGVSTLR